jgi:hypothetical protein
MVAEQPEPDPQKKKKKDCYSGAPGVMAIRFSHQRTPVSMACPPFRMSLRAIMIHEQVLKCENVHDIPAFFVLVQSNGEKHSLLCLVLQATHINDVAMW